jgi:hypothetical protein
MQCVQPSLTDNRKSIVLLQEELTAGVERDSVVGEPFATVFCLLDDKTHCFVPGSPFELSVAANLRVLESIFVVQRIPPVRTISLRSGLAGVVLRV